MLTLRPRFRLVVALLMLAGIALVSHPVDASIDPTGNWVAQGPRPITNGQVEGPTITNGEVVGALHSVACHPTNVNIIYVGGVHGGIWRTTNATAATPVWTQQLPSTATDLAIADLEFDPTDGTNNTLVAGVGYMSSYFQNTTALGGVWRTTNGGTTWTLLGDANLQGENVIAVEARGNILLAGSNARQHILDGVFPGVTQGNGQLTRSTDTGVSWTVISGGAGTGLPAGAVYDIVADPAVNTRFYCSVSGVGVFRSDDSGATWTNITSGSATINGVITNPNNNNTELAVASDGRVYAAIMLNGQLNYIGFTTNPTAAAPAWTQMDTPQVTNQDGNAQGIQPRTKPGSQGGTHFSIVADPTTPTTVYIGGDRQDDNKSLPALTQWPNILGANDYSGNLWRGDSTAGATGAAFSPQWDHLTHSNAVALIPGGGTASGSSPHADSRGMDFDVNGNLIEVDDAGIYRRSSPTNNAGDWFSLNGNLQVTEAHDVAYDTVSDIIIIGNQDVGTAQQTATGSLTWTSLPLEPPFTFTPFGGATPNSSVINFSTGDGGDVAVDAANPAGGSTRYSSFQRLGLFRRQTYDGAGALTGVAYPTLTGGGALTTQFKTPIKLNAVNPLRIVIGGGNGVFESLDQGDNGAFVAGGAGVNRPDALAYGGFSGGVGNPDVLYVGSGNNVLIRTAAAPAPLAASAAYAGGYVRDIILDPADWNTAYVIDRNQVFQTTNAGTSWTDITGDLAAAGGVDFLSVEYVPDPNNDAVLVGTRTGVYFSPLNALGTWTPLGNGLPNAPAWDMDYDVTDDVLVVSTMGRGVWTLTDVSIPDFTPPVISANILRSLLWPARNGMFPIGFSASATDNLDPNPTVTVDIYSDEAAGPPPFSPDAMGTLPANTMLRAQRAFPGNGRVYLVVVTATDAAGNSSAWCRSVVVPVMPVGTWIVNVRGQALAAEAFCQANAGAAPAGYVPLLTYTLP
ncbi:MAG: sialidase family protein [Planctomycetota bacterium]|nr:sialidase family protein [Planctomycetota bacterium]